MPGPRSTLRNLAARDEFREIVPRSSQSDTSRFRQDGKILLARPATSGMRLSVRVSGPDTHSRDFEPETLLGKIRAVTAASLSARYTLALFLSSYFFRRLHVTALALLSLVRASFALARRVFVRAASPGTEVVHELLCDRFFLEICRHSLRKFCPDELGRRTWEDAFGCWDEFTVSGPATSQFALRPRPRGGCDIFLCIVWWTRSTFLTINDFLRF